MVTVFDMLINILSNIENQIGPAYDPLFYDFMVYAFGFIILVIIAIAVIVPIVILRRKKKSSNKGEDTQFY